MNAMAAEIGAELSSSSLRQPCRKATVSFKEHWPVLTRFVRDSRIPMDNNESKCHIHGPMVGRENDYGHGAEWSGQIAVTMYAIFSTLSWNLSKKRVAEFQRAGEDQDTDTS